MSLVGVNSVYNERHSRPFITNPTTVYSYNINMIRSKSVTALIAFFAMAVLFLPVFVFAGPAAAGQQFDPSGGAFGQLLRNIISFINTIIIPFILGIGFLFFVWGMFLYFIKGGADDDAKSQGKSLIVYATAGFVLIFIFWGLIELLARSTGFQDQNLDTTFVPRAPGGQ